VTAESLLISLSWSPIDADRKDAIAGRSNAASAFGDAFRVSAPPSYICPNSTNRSRCTPKYFLEKLLSRTHGIRCLVAALAEAIESIWCGIDIWRR
jgi:hypothetical protein